MTRSAPNDRQAITDLIHIYCRSVDRLDVPLGHIGMVVSGRARELCWRPLIEWISALPVRRSRVVTG